MRERLRRSGIRSIHPVVDITNYVMIELGQPMHGFDLARLSGAIQVRRARAGEQLTLLNDQTIVLHCNDLLIADDSGPLVLAGVMGGANSGVTAKTTDIFLESACFDAVSIAHAGRRHKLLSDSRYRNERGVDPALQSLALARATALILELCGGNPGPIVEVGQAAPAGATIRLRHAQVSRLLGHELAASEIETLLKRLNIAVQQEADGVWQATAPSYRTDLRIEADLVEEIGRLYGYDRIPARAYAASLAGFAIPETVLPNSMLAQRLLGRGYQEIVTYSFVDPVLQKQLDPEAGGIALDNPIAETMSVMRTNLWTGLLSTWIYNRQRQQPRARLFEMGSVYQLVDEAIVETPRIGGLLAGTALPEQWGSRPPRRFDFFDGKADLEAINDQWRYVATLHPALHPGQSARIIDPNSGKSLGWIGTLHPRTAENLDLSEPVTLFELDLSALSCRELPRGVSVPEVPSSRRDLALMVAETVDAESLVKLVRSSGGPHLVSVVVFDIYRGGAIPAGHKSLTLGLIFQHASRTLNIAEIDAAVMEITACVNAQLGGSIRGEDS
jgi:phenylalanyl-tRNA synthetase beta chain